MKRLTMPLVLMLLFASQAHATTQLQQALNALKLAEKEIAELDRGIAEAKDKYKALLIRLNNYPRPWLSELEDAKYLLLEMLSEINAATTARNFVFGIKNQMYRIFLTGDPADVVRLPSSDLWIETSMEASCRSFNALIIGSTAEDAMDQFDAMQEMRDMPMTST